MILISILIAIGQRKTGHSDTKRYPKAPIIGADTVVGRCDAADCAARLGRKRLGSAVRKGSNRRGGWRYQALAMSLTYSAIVVTYIPQIIKAVTERRASVINEGAPTADSVRAAPKQVGAGGVLLGLGALFLLAAALPILAGIGNIIGLFIIGIALYEAWRLNTAIPLRITGPYQVSAPPAAPA